MDFCRSPPPFLAQPGVGFADDIEWDEPIFHDNSLRPLRVNQTKEFGRYMLGTTKVIYSALDEAGNKAVCELDISVQGRHHVYYFQAFFPQERKGNERPRKIPISDVERIPSNTKMVLEIGVRADPRELFLGHNLKLIDSRRGK